MVISLIKGNADFNYSLITYKTMLFNVLVSLYIENHFTNIHEINLFTDTELALIGKGRLTDQLIKDGVLTQHMITELRKEWSQNGENALKVDPRENPGSPEPPKTRRKRKITKTK